VSGIKSSGERGGRHGEKLREPPGPGGYNGRGGWFLKRTADKGLGPRGMRKIRAWKGGGSAWRKEDQCGGWGWRVKGRRERGGLDEERERRGTGRERRGGEAMVGKGEAKGCA